MKSAGRLLVALILIAGHLLLALFIIAIYFPIAREAQRQSLIRWWSRIVLSLCGVRVTSQGRLDAGGQSRMLVLNHISWTDIYVVHTVRATRFVAKSEIRRWPVIGYLCARTGTIFIERGRRHAVHQANQHLAELLREGACIGVFPEGTTSDGQGLLPFHANLIQAAIEAQIPVQPVALRYRKPSGAIALEAAYIGETSLWESLCTVIRGAPMTATVTLLDPIDTRGRTRHQVAALARSAIALSLGLDTVGKPPASEPDLQDELL
ncbi:MAG: lysophospholipid acyltransferase family protein [Burkholderiaceae bacterium]|jgi:1-acyl-sn-glycerol-3-phosphate acyltransferase